MQYIVYTIEYFAILPERVKHFMTFYLFIYFLANLYIRSKDAQSCENYLLAVVKLCIP